MRQHWDLLRHGDKGGSDVDGTILRKAGMWILSAIKGLLCAVLIIVKMLFSGAKLFLLLFALTVRGVLTLINTDSKI